MERLYAILEEIRPDVEFRGNHTLVEDAFIDSFDIVTIISRIEEEYAIEIPVESMKMENFNSAEAIQSMIDSLRG